MSFITLVFFLFCVAHGNYMEISSRKDRSTFSGATATIIWKLNQR